ncbi:uncharacterized protein LOC111047384 isoform X2 [Nilaparvata lugens]|uniref:uncharacterized protein LOC111047384 isoform X2 n=1 Tax=Nilaparvata lugens TaxID=108931 RepID=UPI00193E42CE|nr:uncharacterized protein LOC111047384 isoform X2 [Nilaparvata lugens]
MSLYLALSISEEEEEEEEEGTFSPAELAESLSSLKPHQVMVIGSVVLNQIVVGLAVSYLSVLMCGIGVLMAWRGFSPLRQLPTFHWVCAELALHITLTAHSQAAPRVDGSNLSYRHLLSSHRAHIQQSVAALPRGAFGMCGEFIEGSCGSSQLIHNGGTCSESPFNGRHSPTTATGSKQNGAEKYQFNETYNTDHEI